MQAKAQLSKVKGLKSSAARVCGTDESWNCGSVN